MWQRLSCWGLGHIDFVFRRHTLGVGSGLFGLLPERAASQDAYDPLFLMSDVVMAAVSSESACALRSDGTVWSWGGSEGFQPEQILEGIVKIAAYSSGHYAWT